MNIIDNEVFVSVNYVLNFMGCDWDFDNDYVELWC